MCVWEFFKTSAYILWSSFQDCTELSGFFHPASYKLYLVQNCKRSGVPFINKRVPASTVQVRYAVLKVLFLIGVKVVICFRLIRNSKIGQQSKLKVFNWSKNVPWPLEEGPASRLFLPLLGSDRAILTFFPSNLCLFFLRAASRCLLSEKST
jgi:hypothetical protein